LALAGTKFSALAGLEEILDFISSNGEECAIQKFALESGKDVAVGGTNPLKTIKCIQAFITFETVSVTGRGVINWV